MGKQRPVVLRLASEAVIHPATRAADVFKYDVAGHWLDRRERTGRRQTVRNAEWTAVFLAGPSSLDGLLTNRLAPLLQCSSSSQPDGLRRTGPEQFHAVQPDRSLSRRMQVKSQICTERSSADDPEQDDNQKKTSCFSNIKIFLVSECALMLAQGTVGAYLVSFYRTSYVGVTGLTLRPSSRRSQTVSKDACFS